MTRLIRTLPMVSSLSVLMGFDSTSNFKCILRYLITTAVILQGLKMMQILCSDWLSERARWACLCRSRPPRWSPEEKISVFGDIINPSLTTLVHDWISPGIFFVFHHDLLKSGQQQPSSHYLPGFFSCPAV